MNYIDMEYVQLTPYRGCSRILSRMTFRSSWPSEHLAIRHDCCTRRPGRNHRWFLFHELQAVHPRLVSTIFGFCNGFVFVRLHLENTVARPSGVRLFTSCAMICKSPGKGSAKSWPKDDGKSWWCSTGLVDSGLTD